jgi:hypothetical protein
MTGVPLRRYPEVRYQGTGFPLLALRDSVEP